MDMLYTTDDDAIKEECNVCEHFGLIVLVPIGWA